MEIQPQELKDALDRQEDLLLLDVREPWEFDLVNIPGSTRATQEMIDQMIRAGQFDKPLITICHHGVRSASAAAWLRARGFTNVRSLVGGVDRWAMQMDPSMGRY